MSLDLSTLKVGDRLIFERGNGDRAREVWVDAISDQGPQIGGIYMHSSGGFWGRLHPENAHLYSLVPPPPLIDPGRTFWVDTDGIPYSHNCDKDGLCARRIPIRIIAYEVVE